MKKILSILFSVVMLVTTVTSASFNAFALVQQEDEIKLNETFHYEFSNKKKSEKTIYIKFIPETDGMYEFELSDTTASKTENECMTAYICDGSNKNITISGDGEALAYQNMEFHHIADEHHSDLPENNYTVACRMKKNEMYYLRVKTTDFKAFSVNITVKKGHVCTYYNTIHLGSHGYPGFDSPDNPWSSDEEFGDGYIAKACPSCGKIKYVEKFYAYGTGKATPSQFVYDGRVKKPKVTVYDRMGNVIDSSNYDVQYSQSPVKITSASGIKNVGYGYAHIDFNGKKYSRSNGLMLTYKIVPQSTTLSSVKSTYNGFKVTWKKQATQTTGYQIKYSTNSEFKNAKYVTVSGTKNLSKTISNLKGNTKYYVKVRTYKNVRNQFLDKDEKLYSSWSKSKSVVTKAVKGTSLSKVTPLSKGFKASWKKQTSGTNGYQIKYSTSSKFKNAKYVTIKSTKSTSKTVKKLKAKKKYYVKVRTYKIVNGKRCYSAWSTSKAVTTKK